MIQLSYNDVIFLMAIYFIVKVHTTEKNSGFCGAKIFLAKFWLSLTISTRQSQGLRNNGRIRTIANVII